MLAEDTKREGLACARWGVQVKRFISYHDHNEKEKAESVLQALREGRNIALISDAGMPVMADPGYVVVRACREAGLPVVELPEPMRWSEDCGWLLRAAPGMFFGIGAGEDAPGLHTDGYAFDDALIAPAVRAFEALL